MGFSFGRVGFSDHFEECALFQFQAIKLYSCSISPSKMRLPPFTLFWMINNVCEKQMKFFAWQMWCQRHKARSLAGPKGLLQDMGLVGSMIRWVLGPVGPAGQTRSQGPIVSNIYISNHDPGSKNMQM